MDLWDEMMKVSIDNDALDVEDRAMIKNYLCGQYNKIRLENDKEDFDDYIRAISVTLDLLTPGEHHSKESVQAYAKSIRFKEEDRISRRRAEEERDYEEKVAKDSRQADVDKIKAMTKGVADIVKEVGRAHTGNYYYS